MRRRKRFPKKIPPFFMILICVLACLVYTKLSSGGSGLPSFDKITQSVAQARTAKRRSSIKKKLSPERVRRLQEEYEKEQSEKRKRAQGAQESQDTLGVEVTPAGDFADNDPLLFGNPTNARGDPSILDNYLIKKEGYTLSYNGKKLIANWVAWHLSAQDIGDVGRSNDFDSDKTLPPNFYRVESTDYGYKKYGFERGHICPSADRTSDTFLNSQTFLMINMVPQSPHCNGKVWKDFEDYERSLARQGNELYIIAGAWGKGAKSQKGYFEYIKTKSGQQITVPSHCWKIILLLPEGSNDFSRVTKSTPAICVFISNDQDVPSYATWKNYLVTVDYIEEKTGYDFFAPLPDDIEDTIETRPWIGSGFAN